MKDCLLVALGGALGAVARHLVAVALPLREGTALPLATLTVNVLGCLGLGLLLGWAEAREALSGPTRLLLGTGFLGAFTTFSTFALEGQALARGGAPWLAFGYLTGSVVLGLLAAWVGYALAR